MSTTHATDDPVTHYLCEYSRKPFEECFCRQITGRTVPKIALFCMERFRECPVYRKQAPGDEKTE